MLAWTAHHNLTAGCRIRHVFMVDLREQSFGILVNDVDVLRRLVQRKKNKNNSDEDLTVSNARHLMLEGSLQRKHF